MQSNPRIGENDLSFQKTSDPNSNLTFKVRKLFKPDKSSIKLPLNLGRITFTATFKNNMISNYNKVLLKMLLNAAVNVNEILTFSMQNRVLYFI